MISVNIFKADDDDPAAVIDSDDDVTFPLPYEEVPGKKNSGTY